MRGGFLVTRGLTSYHQPCHNRLSYARLTGFLHNWDHCQPKTPRHETNGLWLVHFALPPCTHTHNSWLSEQNLLQHSLPHCHFGGRFQTLRLIQKNLRHIQQLTKLHARALNNLIWLHNFYSFLHNFFLVSLWPPPNCAHISIRITPRLRGWGFNLGLERERESKGPVDQRPRLDIYNEALCLPFFLSKNTTKS
jgi:hypothetical protein